MAAPTQTVIVKTKSAWASKVNWWQVISSVSALITSFAAGLDPATAAKVTAGVAVGSNFITFILKTFFTTTVSPASLPSSIPTAVVATPMGHESDVPNLAELQRVQAAAKAQG